MSSYAKIADIGCQTEVGIRYSSSGWYKVGSSEIERKIFKAKEVTFTSLSNTLEFVCSASDERDIDEILLLLINEINLLLKDRSFPILNKTLEQAKPEQIDPAITLALLRTLFQVRQYLPNWRQLRDRAYQAFLDKELNPNRLLAGLK